MKTIYKYPLEKEGPQTIPIPKGAEFLSVIEQNNHPAAYFLVDPDRVGWPVTFHVLGTGHLIGEDLSKYILYLGTVSVLDGRLVWHIFAQQSATWSIR